MRNNVPLRLLARLALALSSSPSARALVHRHFDLPANAGFNVSAARASLLGYVGKIRQLGSLPRTAHITWLRPELLRTAESAMLDHGLRAFRALNPEWEVLEYDDAAIDRYLRRKLPAKAYAMISHAHPVEKADLWRLLVMCHEGGLYMDIDRLVNIPMSDVAGEDVRMLLPIFRGFVTREGGNASSRSAAMASPVFTFSQDMMASSAGNPLHCQAAKRNVAARAACRDPLLQISGQCTLYRLGPELYMRSALSTLFGSEAAAISRLLASPDAAVGRGLVAHELRALRPYARVSNELIPTHTMLHSARRATATRSWTAQRLEDEKRRLYQKVRATHWSRQSWWHRNVGRWLALFV